MPHLLPVSERDKDAKILALRHQPSVLERQLGKMKGFFTAGGQTFILLLPGDREEFAGGRRGANGDPPIRSADILQASGFRWYGGRCPGPGGGRCESPCPAAPGGAWS